MCHTACEQDQEVLSWSYSQDVGKPLWHIPLMCVQWKTSDDGQRNCLKLVDFYSKNKFEKLVHLVGFIIRIRIKIKRLFYGRLREGSWAMNLKFTLFHSLKLFYIEYKLCAVIKLNFVVFLSKYLSNLLHKICFTISFISCLYMFRTHVLIIRRSK